MKLIPILVFWIAAPLISHTDSVCIITTSDPFKWFDEHKKSPQPISKKFDIIKAAFQCKGLDVITQIPQDAHVLHAIVFLCLPDEDVRTRIKNIPCRKILYLLEPPTLTPHDFEESFWHDFDIIATWNDDLVQRQTTFKKPKIIKCYYPERTNFQGSEVAFDQRKFCIMVAINSFFWMPAQDYTNLYDERRKIAYWFEKQSPQELDVFGRFWPSELFVFKGPLPGLFPFDPTVKIRTLGEYKFCFCFENTGNTAGYISEKILNCLSSGCVPIYCGARNIEQFIPKNCFIDYRDFSSIEDLYLFLKKISQKEHAAYVHNAQIWLESSASQYFSPEYFAQQMVDLCFDNEKYYQFIHKKSSNSNLQEMRKCSKR